MVVANKTLLMPSMIQVGAILMKDWPGTKKLLGLKSEPYSGQWTLLKALDGSAVDRKIHAAGWNFFFMATEVKAIVFWLAGSGEDTKCVEADLGESRAAALQWSWR